MRWPTEFSVRHRRLACVAEISAAADPTVRSPNLLRTVASLFTTPTNRAVRPAISEIMILVRGKLNNRDDVSDVTNRWSTSESFGDIVSGMEQLTELYT